VRIGVDGSIFVDSIFRDGWGIGDAAVGQMPLSEKSGHISGLVEQVANCGRAGIEPIRHVAFGVTLVAGKIAVNAMPNGKMAGQQGRTARRADRAVDIELSES